MTTQLYRFQFRLFYYTTAKWCLFLQAQRNAYPWLCVMCISVYNTKFIAKVNMEPLFTKRFMWYHFMVREKEGIDTRDIILYIYSYIHMPYIILFFRSLHWNHDDLTMAQFDASEMDSYTLEESWLSRIPTFSMFFCPIQ